jgi:hypothetical protein
MNKLRKELVDEKWKKSGLLVCIAAMLIGLLFSRAILSSALIIFVIIRILHRHVLSQLRDFLASPLLWSMSLLFLLPFISGLWSRDVSQWSQILLIKLPLLLLPVCFAGKDFFAFKDWRKIAFSFLIIITGGVCWSLWQYFPNAVSIHAGYLKAHTIETPLENDHVRFSLLVAMALLTAVFLLIQKGKNEKKIILILLSFVILVFVFYLHILAVRTGIFCLYFGVFVILIWLIRKRRNKLKYALVLILMLLFPVISYFVFPTFKNRVTYFKYDWSLIQKNIFVPGSNDGNRFFSIKAGWRLLNEKPLTGVGFGDIRKETDQLYQSNYPEAKPIDKILPSSEWMMYGAGIGWPGFILFSFAMLIPFFLKRLRKNIFWILLNSFIAFSYLFDIGLEVQFGVFIHAFVLLWWYKWLQLQE